MKTYKNKSRIRTVSLALLMACSLFTGVSSAERIKDITEIEGVRGNPLTGFGLLVGLSDTGDTTLPSRQMLTSLLRRENINVEPSDLLGGNVAVVTVTAQLGPFHREGMRIDVDVSSFGDAESLQGGMLLDTELKGLDGQVYAVAAGPISLGGWGASGSQASVSKNHLTVGRIPGGAIVERAELSEFWKTTPLGRYTTLLLRNSDFTTVERIRQAINKIFPDVARVVDAGAVRIRIPDDLSPEEIPAFIDQISLLEVKVDSPAVVVINEKTGTIVVGENVGISSVAISQGSLVVKVKETEMVSQPTAPFSNAGTTERVPDTIIGVEEKETHLIPVQHAVTISELAKALNAIGATPRDLVAIFNALKKAGALQARIEPM